MSIAVGCVMSLPIWSHVLSSGYMMSLPVWSHFPLSKEGVSVQGGGSLSREEVCPTRGVSVQGVSAQGSLSGGSLSRGETPVDSLPSGQTDICENITFPCGRQLQWWENTDLEFLLWISLFHTICIFRREVTDKSSVWNGREVLW